MILDIRDNPGGLLDQAFAVSNLFLKKGQMVVFTRGRTKRDESNYITEAGEPVRRPAAGRAHLAAQRERLGDRGRRHPGPRPRPDRGRDHVRQGPGADDHAAAQRARLRPGPHHRALLHAVRPLHPARLRLHRARGLRRARSDRKACDEGDGDAKLTDAGRKVYGGDGITPDYCVEPETLSKFVSYLVSRGVFRDVSSHYVVKDGNSTQIAGAGSRSKVESARITAIAKDWEVDDAAFRDLEEVLKKRQIAFEPADIEQNREALRRQMLYEVLLQTYGEGLARERTLAFDPQVQKAVSLVSKAALLLKDPKQYIAQDTTSTVALR